jgi:2-polyprenyl-3-methyl-5-hydroxy-6-metoxy-1,4-benzoquinol methylase
VAVRVSGTLAKETDRLNVYNDNWVEVHSKNPIAKDIAKSTAQIMGAVVPLGSSILDIGCGSGLLVNQINNMGYGYKASGLDWSEPAIRFAREHYQGEYLLANVEQGLSIGRTFDCAVASHILEHLENPHEFLQSVEGLLEPEGYLVVAVPNMDWWNPKSVYRSVSTIFDPEHVVGYSAKGMRKVLEANGYEVVKMISRTHRLAILTAVMITAYRKVVRGKGSGSG